MADDFKVRLEQAIAAARAKMPMDVLFAHFNLGEHCDKQAAKKKACPFCQRPGTFGPFYIRDKAAWTFQCFGDDCRANKANRPCGGDEIGFVGLMEGLIDRTAAMWRFLEIAGIERPVEEKKEKRKRAAKAKPSGSDQSEQSDPPEPADPPDKVIENTGEVSPSPPLPVSQSSTFGGGTERSMAIWTAFHSLLQLRSDDRRMLREQRGQTDANIDRLAFRSNCRTNEAALQVLRERFDMRDLIRVGLWKRGPNGTPVIETQFTGWGISGKKKLPNGKTEEVWGWTERILIPYLDRFGRIYFMRPHKGNIAKADKYDDEVCGGHVYCPFLLAPSLEATEGLLVLTESEFKAAALWACGIPAIGIPGTGFVRNKVFRDELVKLLSQFQVREVVIVFDNENKGLPGLPGYKEDPWDREDTAVWAKYIAWDLMKKTPRPPTLERVRIGWLPDEWRLDDAGADTGKIDWDTALANFVRRQGSHPAGIAAATAAFWTVLNEAVYSADFEKRFSKQRQQVISKKLGDIWHEPSLPHGGPKEERMAARLDRIDAPSPQALVFCARGMSTALRSIIGCYYERNEPTEKRRRVLDKQLEEINAEIQKLEEANDPAKDADLLRHKEERVLLYQLLQGKPEPLSNFTMRCEYCLHTLDGSTIWMTRFKDTLKRDSGLIRLSGESMSGLKDFHKFCYSKTKGIASWFGGVKHQQKLNTDTIHASAHRDIFEIDAYGWHPPTGIWFFADAAFPPGGGTVPADENNVFWVDSIGYQIDPSKEERGLSFDQGAPLLLEGSLKRLPIPQGSRSDSTDKDRLQWLWSEFQWNLFHTIGGYDALYTLGMVLAYAAGPEIFHTHGCQPGLWLCGKRSSGKTTIVRWLMRIWGFPELTGIRIDRGTTHVGMARDLNQNSFLPFWFDEYRRDVDPEKESVLRGAFDRSGTAKGMMDQTNKTRNVKARTVPIVTGESSSGDAATHGRYGHVLIAASRRMKEGDKARYELLQSLSRHLHHVGRFVMEHRAEFVRLTLLALDHWLETPHIRESIPDERTRIVHGVGLAAFTALNALLEIWKPVETEWIQTDGKWQPRPESMTETFANYLIGHSQQAFADVQEASMVNTFWQNVISGISRGEIPRSLFLEGKFTIDEHGNAKPYSVLELSSEQKPARHLLFIAAKPVYDLYSADFRKVSGSIAPLSYAGIRSEISKEVFWVAPPTDGDRVHRPYICKQRHSCWCVDLAAFPPAQEILDALADPNQE